MNLKCTLEESLGFCFLCSNVEPYAVAVQVTNSPHPCCRWRWFPPRGDRRSSALPNIIAWHYHKDRQLLRGAASMCQASMTLHRWASEGYPRGSLTPSPFPAILLSPNHLWDHSFRWEGKSRLQTELDNAVSQPKGTDSLEWYPHHAVQHTKP